jgi:hypothetical protein
VFPEQALPCGAPQFLGRTIRKLSPITVAAGTPLAKIQERFNSLAQVGGHTFKHLDESVHGIEKVPPLSELATGVIFDDCESTAGLGRVAKKSGMLIPTDPSILARLCSSGSAGTGGSTNGRLRGTTIIQDDCDGWPLFKSFTPRCWELMAAIFQRGNAMLEAGHLRVMTGVGLATNASASDIRADNASFNGHCFNVGFVQTPAMERPHCFLLEGTAPMIQLKVTATSPRVTLNLFTDPTDSSKFTTEIHDMARFLTELGRSVTVMTQVINAPKGGHSQLACGWPHATPIKGWLTSVMVMNSLDSDPDTELRFYNRIMYMGWPCTEAGQGCMPIEEPCTVAQHPQLSSDPPPEGVLTAGCHPYSLQNLDIRGFDARMSPDKLKIMKDIMNEATPPAGDDKVFRQLASYWVPCAPLEDANVRDQAMREKGVEYIRVGSMETPSVPEHIPLILEAKRQLIHRTNQINMAKPNSDGILGSVLPLGTGVHTFLDVPQRDIHQLTYIESLKQAMEELKWPGFTHHSPPPRV